MASENSAPDLTYQTINPKVLALCDYPAILDKSETEGLYRIFSKTTNEILLSFARKKVWFF